MHLFKNKGIWCLHCSGILCFKLKKSGLHMLGGWRLPHILPFSGLKRPPLEMLTENDVLSVSDHCTWQFAERDKCNERRNALPLLLPSSTRGDRQGQAIMKDKLNYLLFTSIKTAGPWKESRCSGECWKPGREEPCRQLCEVWDLTRFTLPSLRQSPWVMESCGFVRDQNLKKNIRFVNTKPSGQRCKATHKPQLMLS